MQQRSEPHDSLDDFPTPPWATRALCEWLKDEGHELKSATCREPTANRGHMVAPLREHFGLVLPSDVHDYGVGFPVRDYLFGPSTDFDPSHWTVMNPPFRLAEQFIERAIDRSTVGCAAIVRVAFLEGIGRYERLFSKTAPTHILQFSERVVMHKARLAPEGSTATAYAWLIWMGRCEGSWFGWIPPCRKQLERSSDYSWGTD